MRMRSSRSPSRVRCQASSDRLASAPDDIRAAVYGGGGPPETEGVYHSGFARDALSALLQEAGFAAPRFVTACEVTKEDRRYSVFLVTASKPA